MDKPILIIIAGANGCGKTTLTAPIKRHKWSEGCEVINPDVIAAEQFGGWTQKNLKAVLNHCEKYRNRLLKKRLSMILETTFTHEEKFAFIRKAKNAGYFIRLYFIGTDTPVINAGRVCARMLNGGHEVYINKIIKRHTGSREMCLISAPLVDRLYIFDNSADKQDPVELIRVRDQKIVKIAPNIKEHSWAIDMLREIPEMVATYNESTKNKASEATQKGEVA